MTATTAIHEALKRTRAHYPYWNIAYTPDAPEWRRWTAVRRLPLSPPEQEDNRRRVIVGPNLDQFLGDLGAEQRAQDILASSTT